MERVALRGRTRGFATNLTAYPMNIWPVTDDRAFFFRYSYWWHVNPDSQLV